jgi:hydroxyethylthiazole kinase-like uncharacterized protein yjeF
MQENEQHLRLSKKYIKAILRKRNALSHKGDYGKAIIVAGSFGKMGAAVLAAKACLRTGVGLLTMYIPACGYTVLQTAVPEAMVMCDEHEKMITATVNFDRFNVMGIGCGLGTSTETAKALKDILLNYDRPIVIDADAINIIGNNKRLLKSVPAQSIFTPHQMEFERLIGKTNTKAEEEKLQKAFSKKHKVFVVLKGHETFITCPCGKSYTNTTGNAGMAKGGSGDALTGMLTALLAQGYTAEQSCVTGVYLHGLAGDIAVKKTGEYSLLPSDLIDNIGKAFLKVFE